MDGKPSGVRRAAARGACRRATSRSPTAPSLYHCGIDETVTPADTGHKYEHDYSICHSDRHMDDFGIELSTRGARVGRDDAALRDEVVWRRVSGARTRAAPLGARRSPR